MDAAQRQQIDRRASNGAQFDRSLFETPEAKRAVLDNLMAEALCNAEIARNHLTVSDAALHQGNHCNPDLRSRTASSTWSATRPRWPRRA